MSLGNVNIDGELLTTNMVTGYSGSRVIGAGDFNSTGTTIHTVRVRLAVRIDTNPMFSSPSWYYSGWHSPGYACSSFPSIPIHNCISVAVPTLTDDTKYYVAVNIQYDEGAGGLVLHDSVVGSFFTDRSPLAPTLVSPVNNESFDGLSPITFDWTFNDPDSSLGPPYSVQGEGVVSYRVAATPLSPAGPWVTSGTCATTCSNTSLTLPVALFSANSQYEWKVDTFDHAGLGSPSSEVRSFFVGGTVAPPTLLTPIGDAVVEASVATVLTWKFRDPDQDSLQTQADIRYREAGTLVWTTLTGAGAVPGTDQFWEIAADTFDVGTRIEWQAQTYNTLGLPSDWSPSSFFWAVAVGEDSGTPVPTLSENQHMLGVGNNRAYVYQRGGRKRLGEITPMSSIMWCRKRDDISNSLITTNGFGEDGGALLSQVRTWRHEIVVFRDDERVWEGPITRISELADGLEIEAKDVMAYVYRRIMRQAYNDAYRVVNGVQQGLHTVIYRAKQIIMNALGYDDPNVLAYVTALNNDDDAQQSRIVSGYSKSAWAEIDDMAATAGLDYTTVGRRIILIDTHRQVGRLPEMGNGDFSDPPVVTEYGMQAANVFAVTNNSGVFGLASRIQVDSGGHSIIPPEGHLEQVASAYGESAGAATVTVLTPAAKAKLEATLDAQAERNIAPRWPVPVIVRVPDNTTLNPELNIGINQLVPGIWIPLRSVGRLRKVDQIQKLDSMQVNQSGDSAEKITVIMSPAPLAGEDDVPPEEG